jgi:hypothetical protein
MSLAREPADLAGACRRHGLHRRAVAVLCTLLGAQGRLYSAAEISNWLADIGFEIVARAITSLGRSVLTAF